MARSMIMFLPGEKVEPGEIVEKEDLDVVLEELKEF
jgi:hypothetical protein